MNIIQIKKFYIDFNFRIVFFVSGNSTMFNFSLNKINIILPKKLKRILKLNFKILRELNTGHQSSQNF